MTGSGWPPTAAALRTARSAALFVGGLAGVAYEVVVDHGERPTILILLAGMMGLPAFIPGKKDPPGDPARKDPSP